MVVCQSVCELHCCNAMIDDLAIDLFVTKQGTKRHWADTIGHKLNHSKRLLAMIRFLFCIVILAYAGAANAQERGMDTALQVAFARGELRGLHGVYAEYKGQTIADVYFRGADRNWGTKLPVRDHGPDTLHDLRSISKSITSLLYGIALDRGLVPPVSESLIAQFPQYPDLANDIARRSITIEDALTMQMGIQWSEDLPYTDPRNSEIAMELSDDRYHFVLSRPMTGTPGKTWVYNGGATALVAAIIERGTGMRLEQFTDEALFAPLGITSFEWAKGRDGIAAAASGLRLSARALATIGRMIKADGLHDGQRIVSQAWLSASRTPRTRTAVGLRYGYFWWLPPGDASPRWMAGFGNGGQRLTINHVDDLILVILAGRYNEPDGWKLPVQVIEDFLLPAIAERE